MTAEEERYEAAFKTFSERVAEVTKFWFAASTMNEVAKVSPATLEAFNQSAAFWIAVKVGLEHQAIVALGKIFGQRNANPHNIDSFFQVLRETCLVVFSKDSLAERKRRDSPHSHDWLPEFLDRAHIPTVDEINGLQRLARPHRKTYEEQYQPIRNQVIAHTDNVDTNVRWAMYQRTSVPDLENAVVFLNRFRRAVLALYSDGRKPEIDISRQTVEGIVAKTDDQLRDGWDEEYIVGETRKALELLTQRTIVQPAQ